MRISVIIPAYNEELYLGRLLQSLQSQTVPADEIIVVDNNCRDQTVSVARKLGAKVVKETKQGMIYARNKGFDSARFELIARCDADVLVPPDWLEIILQNFQNQGLSGLSGPVIYHDSFLKHASTLPSRLYLETLRFLTGGRRYLVGPNMVITKDVWHQIRDKVCLLDRAVHEDVDLSLNIFKVGGQIGYDPRLVVKTSSRRIIRRPHSFFLEYPLRMIKTFRLNRTSK